MLARAPDAIRRRGGSSYTALTLSLRGRNRRLTPRANSPLRNVRLLIVLVSLAALALVSSAPALAVTASAARVPGSEGVELFNGRGYAVLESNGSVLGKVRRGWIRVLNIGEGGVPEGWVRGCETRSGRLSGRLHCTGTGLRFYVYNGRWRIRIKGKGINVSGVIRGSVGLNRGACTRCRFKIGDGPRRRWPNTFRVYTVRD